MKILVSESLSKQGVEILEKAGFTVHIKTKLSKEELIREIGQYDGVIVRSATKVTADLIAAAERLKVIGRAGSGLDNVDTQAATRRGIVVMNTPGGNTVTTAEHTMAMICAMTCQIAEETASMKARKWEKDRFMGVELYNKTLGIVGIGQIGGYLAKLAQGMSMNVIAYDPYLAEERATKMGVEMVELAELFRRADIISLHTPLTAETRSLINAAAIQQMKPGVMIVNCARGGIVNEADLFQALKSKRVAAAAFDVFEDEPVSPDHPLLTLAPLTIAVLKGLLPPILENAVNYVNAPVIAKERGIEVKEVKSSDAGDFASVIRVRVDAGKKPHRLAGTLHNRKDPRIIEIDEFQVEVVPEGHMLLILNVDRPGVIGAVGQVLGDHSVNIARMQCSREERGGTALLIIGLDAPLPAGVLETIRRGKHILSVKLVDLSKGL